MIEQADVIGAGGRQIAEASGLRIPLVPTAQQLFVTHPLPGVRADLPMVRIMDAGCMCGPATAGCCGACTRRIRDFST